MNSGILRLIVVSILLIQMSAAATPEAAAAGQASAGSAGQPEFHSRNPRYQLQVGDVLNISFRLTPEYDQAVTIQPDGYINLRDLPDLYAAGKTTPELAKAIRKAYSDMLNDPVVTVQLKEFEKPYFTVGGEVGRPGKYELRGDTTVTEAVMMAGGFNEKSKHSQVLLFRRVSDQWTEARKLNIKAMLKSANLDEDFQVRPGDLIYVPQNALSKIQRFIPNSAVSLYTNPIN